MEQKFRYGIWKVPEWNGRQSSILPYQFHTRFRAMYLLKNIYGCRVVINNTALSQKYSTSISTRIICRQIAVLWLCILRKKCTYFIIVSTLQFAALMLQLTTLIGLICCCILRLTICQVVIFFYLVTKICNCYFIPVSA